MLFLFTTLAVLLAGTDAAVAVGGRVKLLKCDAMKAKFPFQGKIFHRGRMYNNIPITWNVVLEPFCDKCFKVKTLDNETGTMGIDCTTTPTAVCTKQGGTLYFRDTMTVPGGESCKFAAEIAAEKAAAEKAAAEKAAAEKAAAEKAAAEKAAAEKAAAEKEKKKMCSDYDGDKKGCRLNLQGYQEGVICKFKGEKCKSFSCGDMPKKPVKCGRKGKQLGLTCFYNPKSKTCGEAKPEGLTCADYDGDKKACKKDSKAIGLKCAFGKKASKGKCIAKM